MEAQIQFPDKKYNVIYADPPWSYYNDMTVTPRDNKTGKGSMSHPSYPVKRNLCWTLDC